MRKLKLEELQRPGVKEYSEIQKIPIIVLLDNIRSAMNVGSFFRTCDAFKISKIILCGITAQPPHKEILKTAIGATESVSWAYAKEIKDIVIELRNQDFQIVGIEQTNKSISCADFIVDNNRHYALVFGNEVEGINSNILPYLDCAIEIPQFGTKHSLNVSVCGGIILWHFAHKYF